MAGVAVFTTLVAYLFGPLFDQVLTREQQGSVMQQVSGVPGVPGVPGVSGVFDRHALRQTPVIRFLDMSLGKAQNALGVTERNRVIALPFLLFLVFAAKNVCAFVAEYRFNAVGLAFVRDLRSSLYRRLLLQSGSFHAAHPSGDLIARVTGDVDRIQNLFGTDLADLVQSVATLLGLVVLVVSRSLELTLVALLVAPAIAVPVVSVARRLRAISRAGRERMGDLTGLLSETVRGHRVVQAYGAESYESRRFDSVNERTFRLLKRAAGVMALSSPLVETASVLVFLILLAYAGRRIAAHTLTLGDFISFGVGLVMMYQPFKRATRTNLALQHALASARRLFEILDAPLEVVEAPGARALGPFGREIRYRDVSFAYPGREPSLSEIDLVIPRGSVTAIVGPSGAGKTTLVNLLPRFMDVGSGRLEIDGTDVRSVTLASLRASFGLVTQEVVLFDDTVRSNVAYGREEVSEERVLEALRAANAEGFVRELPGGLNARVGEAGSRLSGGQRQRLAIARALLKDPPILILDEATSALDTESERAVQEALDRLMEGRTVLVIAHRLSTVRRADQLVVLDRGRIVEKGSHAGLLAAEGLYRRLYDMQFFEQTDAGRPA